jgi:23S rRNA pseudouridine1911/1915/1917 synthase
VNSPVKPQFLLVPRTRAGERLDCYLASCPELGISRSRAGRLLAEGWVTIDGQPGRAAHRLRGGERIEVMVPPTEDVDLEPEPIQLDVVYEDEDVIVINKPRGMVVHPSPGHGAGTLVNALLHHCRTLSSLGEAYRPGIVHRLDKDTTGLIMVAKNDAAHESLARQLRDRVAGREYLALVRGVVLDEQGIICAPLGRHPVDRQRFTVLAPGEGKEAVTRFLVAERFPGFTLLQLSLDTGRTHQIRVHLAYLGYPVVGDPVYGRGVRRLLERQGLPRLSGQALHAFRLTFRHPRTGDQITFEAPVPRDFQAVLDALRALGEESRWPS